MSSILEFLNQNDAVRAFGLSLLHSLWQGAIIAALLWLILKVADHVSARTKYAFALFASVLLLACFAFTFSYNLGSSETDVMKDQAQTILIVTSDQVSETAKNQHVVQQLETHWLSIKSWVQLHVSYFLLAWFAGFLLYTSRMVSGMLYLQNIKQKSVLLTPYWSAKVIALQQKLELHTRVSLLSSDKVNSPFTFGWLKPVIVVPASMLTLLPSDQVESILLHELTHIRRHDYVVNLLQSITELIFFFNPGYHYIMQVLETEREHICDDLVVRHTGNQRAYALALANLAQFPNVVDSRLALAATGKEGSLLKRIKRIMHTSNPTTMKKNTNNRKGYQVTTLLIACFLFALMAVNVNGKNMLADTKKIALAAAKTQDKRAVSGVVLSQNGKALPGVTVQVKHGTTGTATGADGKYTLTVLPTDTLVYRFIGFEPRELAATDKATQRVVLKQADKPISAQAVEVVQVEGKPLTAAAIGNKKRLDVTEKAIDSQAEVSVQGKPLFTQTVSIEGEQQVDPGVITVTGRKSESTGETITVTGSATEKPEQAVSIKGVSSESAKLPLYYIYEGDALKGLKSGTDAFRRAAANGKQVTDLKDIKPEFIQAIQVLKDKHAISTFGEAAKNGAVLISLKENTYQPGTTENSEELIVYPVPSDRFVKLKFYLNKKQHVKAEALDLYGSQVKSLANKVLDRGWHEFEWDASRNPAGTYFIVLHKENGLLNKKVLLK